MPQNGPVRKKIKSWLYKSGVDGNYYPKFSDSEGTFIYCEDYHGDHDEIYISARKKDGTEVIRYYMDAVCEIIWEEPQEVKV